MNGLQATRKILQMLPETLVLMLSMHTEETWVRQAIDAGARGYVLKNAMDLELSSAIRRLVAGGRQCLMDSFPSSRRYGRAQFGLTPREVEILQLICDGKSNKEIANPVGVERQHHRRSSRQYHGRAGNS